MCFRLPSKLQTPHRPANTANRTLTGGLSQLRFVESQAPAGVLTGPQTDVRAAA